MKTAVLYLFLAIILASPAFSTEINFALDRESSLPDSFYIDENTELKFIDFDEDGYDEVLVENDSVIAVYSIHHSQTTDYFRKYNDTLPRGYAYGYLDGDSLLDFVEVFAVEDSVIDPYLFCYFSYATLKACQMLSSEQYLSSDTVIFYQRSDPDVSAYRINDLMVYDEDHDGSLEIFGKISIRDITDLGFLLYREDFAYDFYRHDYDTDSTTEIGYWPPTETGNIIHGTGFDQYNAYVESYDHWAEGSGHGYVEYTYVHSYDSLYLFEGDSLVIAQKIGPLITCPSGSSYKVSTNNVLYYWCSDMTGGYSGLEMATFMKYRIYGETSEYGQPPIVYCSDTYYKLILFNLSIPDSLSTLWEIDYAEHPGIEGLFAVESIVNYFLAFQSGRLYVYRCSEGSVVDSSDFISDGRFVDYRAVDTTDHKYLILLEDSSLKMYGLDIVVAVEEEPPVLLPQSFVLGKPYPNPFNAAVTIPLTVPRRMHVTVRAYNILGQKVDEIFNGQLTAGTVELNWDGGTLSSGIYFIQAELGDSKRTVKVTLLK